MIMTITINLDNAAFDPPNTGAELARILADVASKLEHCCHQRTGGLRQNLYDMNGNEVGAMTTSQE